MIHNTPRLKEKTTMGARFERLNSGSIRRSAGRAVLAAAAAAMLGGAAAAEAATPEEKCQSGKNSAAGKYASCVATAEKVYVLTGDATKYGAALTKCQSKMATLWSKLEQKAVDAMTTCPSTGDQVAIEDFLDACTQSVAVALGGDPLPLNVIDCNDDLGTCTTDLSTTNADLADCDADLAVCESEPTAGLLKTQQSVCYTAGGAVTPCAGTGQDGEIQPGVARGYTDNGDGTITDNATGLMWEKLSDDGSIHDKDNTYIWSNAFALKVATLNSTVFAGHADWRVPTIEELQSINSYGYFSPSVDPAFHSGCVGGCDVTNCSCTVAAAHWSSTTYLGGTASAWANYFTGGLIDDVTKGTSIRVRAVRGATDAEVCTVAELAAAENDLANCEDDLALCTSNCDAAVRPPLSTGQTTAYGAGTDGDLEKGGVRSFTDNGDGTITDNVTGLMWEKKSDDGSIHDKDNTYTWGLESPPYTMNGTMVTTFLADLNSGGGFAGYTDWRIPNLHELESLRNMEASNLAVYPAFNDACTGGCSVTTCSCTRSGPHWSSTTFQAFPDGAWVVYSYEGYSYFGYKTAGLFVRAVRSGS